MKRFVYILSAVALLACLPAGEAAAQLFRKKKKDTGSQQPAVTAVVSPYDRLILNAKDRVTKGEGALKIHKVGEKIYLEVSDDLFGRELLLSSYLDRTGDLSMAEPGRQAMNPARYTLEKTDSLVLLRQPTYNIHVKDGDANIKKALAMSRTAATVMSFPIETVNFDTTAVVFDATRLLTVANSNLVDMTGKQLSGDFRVSSSRPDTKFAFVEGIDAFRKGVSVSSETGLKLEATGYMGFVTMDLESTVALTAYLTVLPSERMKTREADSRIGTGYVPYTAFTAEGGAETGYFSKRVKLEPREEPSSEGLYFARERIEVYVDTLFNMQWHYAIKEGFDSWNDAFMEAGYSMPIQIRPYPADDPDFNANDPTLKTVRFGHGTGTSITHQTFDDPRTGEIIGFTITVPRDYVQSLRRNSVYTISEVDPRYREYFLPDSAVYEGLRAEIVRTAGLCLGLAPNYAGSHAYRPADLRDPAFTKEKGFTASVTGGPLFNFIARPGDRERGVQTVVTKPGAHDRFAIKWLYSPIGEDEKETLGRWLAEKEGNPEYLYVRPQSARAPYDPRAYQKDLGNDVFESADRLLENIKFVMANADRWLDDDRIPTDYKTLFTDYAVLKFDDIVLSLCNYVGGIYIDETVESSGRPYYEPVPREMQRRAMLKLLSLFDDLSWMDSNPRLLNMVGRDRSVSPYVADNWPVRYLMMRITGRNGAMGLAVQKSATPYTEEEALTDLAGYIFGDVKKGREMTGTRLSMARAYIDQLIYSVPVLKANYENNTASNSLAAGLFELPTVDGLAEISMNGAMGTITSFDYYTLPDNGALYTKKLKEAKSYFSTGLAYCRSQYARDRYNYYISKIDMALKSPVR